MKKILSHKGKCLGYALYNVYMWRKRRNKNENKQNKIRRIKECEGSVVSALQKRFGAIPGEAMKLKKIPRVNERRNGIYVALLETPQNTRHMFGINILGKNFEYADSDAIPSTGKFNMQYFEAVINNLTAQERQRDIDWYNVSRTKCNVSDCILEELEKAIKNEVNYSNT